MTRINRPRIDPPAHEPKPKARGLRRVSKRMAKIKAETNGPRAEFVKAVGCCMVEGCPNPPQDMPHEITCGNGREAALYQPRMQMAVCPEHHHAFHNDVRWTKKRQLAHRVRWELEQFAAEFSGGLGYATSYYSADEIILYLMLPKEIKPKKRRTKAAKKGIET